MGTIVDARMICEDLGPPEIDIQVTGCVLSYVPVDGGSGVNIMIEATAQQLGFTKLQPTARIMRLADGARVLPVGTLTHIPTVIGGKEFLLNYLVMRLARPSTYPVLVGRPWLYGASDFRLPGGRRNSGLGKMQCRGERLHTKGRPLKKKRSIIQKYLLSWSQMKMRCSCWILLVI